MDKICALIAKSAPKQNTINLNLLHRGIGFFTQEIEDNGLYLLSRHNEPTEMIGLPR
ncbi:hypothetical protein DSECCO2_302940 [anaerobic digester metagenome]